jgi:hypothetical protein
VLALLVWLFFVIFGLAVGTSSPSSTGHSGTVVTVPVLHSVPFTVNSRKVATDKPIQLHKGDLLRFAPGVSTLSVIRIECVSDTHRVALSHSRWRVPDLPTGEYDLEVALPGSAAGAEVSVVSHEAPCPGP